MSFLLNQCHFKYLSSWKAPVPYLVTKLAGRFILKNCHSFWINAFPNICHPENLLYPPIPGEKIGWLCRPYLQVTFNSSQMFHLRAWNSTTNIFLTYINQTTSCLFEQNLGSQFELECPAKCNYLGTCSVTDTVIWNWKFHSEIKYEMDFLKNQSNFGKSPTNHQIHEKKNMRDFLIDFFKKLYIFFFMTWPSTLLVSRSEHPRDKPFLLTIVSYLKE